MLDGVRRMPMLVWRLLYPVLLYMVMTEMVFGGWHLLVGGEPEAGMILPLTAVAAALVVVILGRRYRKPRRRMRSASVLFWSALAGMGACLCANNILMLVPLHTKTYETARQLLYQPPFVVQLLCTGLVIPMAEELVFRGFCYRSLRRELPVYGAMVLSAAYFGLFHGNLFQGIYAMLIGLLLALLYEWTRSLTAVWGFHAAANITAITVTKLGGGAESASTAFMLLVAATGGGAALLSLKKIREEKNGEITIHSDSVL